MSICRYDWGTFNPSHGSTYPQCHVCGWNIDEREESICEITPKEDRVMFYHDVCYHPCPDQKIDLRVFLTKSGDQKIVEVSE